MKRIHIVILLIGLLMPANAAAAGDIRLDEIRRVALARLPVVLGPPLAEGDLQDRVVVVAFFASWCPPCDPEFDYLKRIHAKYSPMILAVNIFEDWGSLGSDARLRGFLKRKAPSFRVLGEGEAVAELFGHVDRIPTVFVFGSEGATSLHFVHAQGASKTHVDFEELEAAVRAAQ